MNKVPQGYSSHAEFHAERLRDDLRGELNILLTSDSNDPFDLEVANERVEAILDKMTQAMHDLQNDILGIDPHDDLDYGEDHCDEPDDGYLGSGFDGEALASAGWGTDEDYGCYGGFGDDW